MDQYATENLGLALSKEGKRDREERFIWGSCRMLISERFDDYIVDGNSENGKAELLFLPFQNFPSQTEK